MLNQRQIEAKEIKYHVLAQYTILICKALICGAVTYSLCKVTACAPRLTDTVSVVLRLIAS